MSFTLCTSGAAFAKAGEGATDLFEISGSYLTKLQEFSDEAEGTINTLTRRDWLSGATVLTTFKPILAETASAMIATKIINYDMSGFTSRAEATTMLDVLRDIINRNLRDLKDKKYQEKME